MKRRMKEGAVYYGCAEQYLRAEGWGGRYGGLSQRRGQARRLVGGGPGWGAVLGRVRPSWLRLLLALVQVVLQLF